VVLPHLGTGSSAGSFAGCVIERLEHSNKKERLEDRFFSGNNWHTVLVS
jgi:hypothetical protein